MSDYLKSNRQEPAPYDELLEYEKCIDSCPGNDQTAGRLSTVRKNMRKMAHMRLIGERYDNVLETRSDSDQYAHDEAFLNNDDKFESQNSEVLNKVCLSQSQLRDAVRYSVPEEILKIPTVYDNPVYERSNSKDSETFDSPSQVLEYLGIYKKSDLPNKKFMSNKFGQKILQSNNIFSDFVCFLRKLLCSDVL